MAAPRCSTLSSEASGLRGALAQEQSERARLLGGMRGALSGLGTCGDSEGRLRQELLAVHQVGDAWGRVGVTELLAGCAPGGWELNLARCVCVSVCDLCVWLDQEAAKLIRQPLLLAVHHRLVEEVKE